VGFADEARACFEQAIDRCCRVNRRRMCLKPQRVTVSGTMTRNVENVLDRHGQPLQGAVAATRNSHMRVAAEGIEGIV
jgi:hypothetical protein